MSRNVDNLINTTTNTDVSIFVAAGIAAIEVAAGLMLRVGHQKALVVAGKKQSRSEYRPRVMPTCIWQAQIPMLKTEVVDIAQGPILAQIMIVVLLLCSERVLIALLRNVLSAC